MQASSAKPVQFIYTQYHLQEASIQHLKHLSRKQELYPLLNYLREKKIKKKNTPPPLFSVLWLKTGKSQLTLSAFGCLTVFEDKVQKYPARKTELWLGSAVLSSQSIFQIPLAFATDLQPLS